MLNINTGFKLEGIGNLQSKIDSALQSLDTTIKINNVEFNDDAFSSQISSINNAFKNLQNQLNNSFSGIKLNDLEKVLSLVKELNQYNKGLRINFITEGISDTVKESLGKETNAVKEFAKETGLSYSKELIESIKQGMQSNNLDSTFNELANKGLEKIKETKKELSHDDESNYLQGFLKSCDKLEEKLKAVETIKEKMANSKMNEIKFVDEKSVTALNEASSKVTEIRGKNGELNKIISQQKVEEGKVVESVHKVNEATGKLEQTQSKVTVNYEQQAKAAEKVVQEQEKLNSKIQTFKNNMNAKMDSFSARNSGLFNVQEFERLKNAVNNFNPRSISDCNSAAQRLNSEFRMLSSSANQAKAESSGLFSSIKRGASEALGYLGVGSLAFGIFDQLKKGTEYISNMDNLISDLKITMNGTNQEFNGMVSQAGQMANTLGSTTQDIMNVASIYANMNESIQSIMSKTKADVMLSNLAQLGAKETTDAMQAFFNQFNLGTQDVEKDAMMISDSMVAVSKSMAMNFSQGIREMIEGVKVSGSIAKESGMDLQHYEALIGTVAQVTRASGSEIGNAWKTILSRMGRVKPTTKEGVEAINKCEKALNSVGVQLRSDQNTFRDTGSVLDDLGAKWGNLTQAQRSQIAEEAAGVRQKGYFLALMNHYSTYTDLATKAVNSQGQAMAANQIYLQSTAAKMKLLTNATQQFFGVALKSDDLKSLIMALTDIVHVATFVVDKFGIIGTAAGIMCTKMITSSMSFKNLMTEMKLTGSITDALNNKFSHIGDSFKLNNITASFENIKKSLSQVSKESQSAKSAIVKGIGEGEIAIKKFNGTAKVIPKTMEQAVIGGKKFGIVKNVVRGVGTEAVTTSSKIYILGKAFDIAGMKAMAFQAVASIGMSLVISAVVGGITKLISKAHEAKHSFEDMNASMQGKASQVNNLDAMARKMDTLSKKAHLNAYEQKKLNTIQRQIAQTNPALITGYDREGHAIAQDSKAVRELVKEKRNLLEAELRANINKQQANINNEIENYKKAKKSVQELTQELAFHQRAMKANGMSQQEIAKQTQSYSDELNNQAKLMDKSRNNIENYKGSVSALNKLEYDSAKAIIQNINANKRKKASIDDVRKSLQDQGIDAKVVDRVLKDYANGAFDAADGNKKLQGNVEDANGALKKQAGELENLSGKLDFYKKVLQEFKEHSAISRDTFNQIISKHRELLPLLKDEAHFQQNIQKMIDNTTQAYDKQAATAIEGSGSIADAINSTIDSVGNNAANAGNNISNMASQTGANIDDIANNSANNISNQANNASSNVSNSSANTANNVNNDISGIENNSASAGGNISDISAGTGDNISSTSSGTANNIHGDINGIGDHIGNQANNSANDVIGSANDSAQGMASAMDGAVNAMNGAYSVDVNNFNGACNAKISAANAAAAQIAAAFNAVMNQFSAAEKSFQSQGGVGGKIESMNGAERAHAMAQINAYHITTPRINYQPAGGVHVGYSGSGSSHSAGGGGGGARRRRSGSGSGGGGGGSRRHSSSPRYHSSSPSSRSVGYHGSSYKPSHYSGRGNGGNSSSYKEHIEDISVEIDRYSKLNAVIKDLSVQLEELSDLQSQNPDNIQYVKEEIQLLEKKKQAIENLKSEQNRELNELKDKLRSGHFVIDDNNMIINYKEEMKSWEKWANGASGDLKKRRIENTKAIEKDIQRFMELSHDVIKQSDKDIRDVIGNIKEALQKQLDYIGDIHDKIVDMMNKQKDIALDNIEKETQAKLDAISKEQDAYDKKNDEDDYQKSLQTEREALEKLQQEKANAMLDMSQNGLSKVEDYNKQIQEQQDKIQDMIRDKQRKANDDKFQEEQDLLQKQSDAKKEQIEKDWSDEEIMKKANKAIADGYFESITGRVIDLKDAMLEYTDKFQKGLSLLGDQIKTKLVDKLKESRNIMRDINNITKQLHLENIPSKTTGIFNEKNVDFMKDLGNRLQNISFATIKQTPFNFKVPEKVITNNTQNQNNNHKKVEININTPLINIQGGTNDEQIKTIEKKLNEFKQELVNEIVYNS